MPNFTESFLEFLLKCRYIAESKVFLNAVSAEKDNIGLITTQVDRNQDQEYVDGSVMHKVIFTIQNYKIVEFDPVDPSSIGGNVNIESLLDAQQVIDYIETCNRKGLFPCFGEGYSVERMESTYLTPSTPTITEANNPLAKFQIPIAVYVFDETGTLWNEQESEDEQQN